MFCLFCTRIFSRSALTCMSLSQRVFEDKLTPHCGLEDLALSPNLKDPAESIIRFGNHIHTHKYIRTSRNFRNNYNYYNYLSLQ